MSPEHSHSVRRIPSLAACLAGAGVLMTLATAFVLILYACPAADDLYRAGIIRTRSWYSEVALNYFIWSGRWSGIGLALVILPRVDIVRWYPILLGALVFFQALGLKTFWRMLLGGTVTRRQVLVLTAATMAVLWASLPYPGETCYWITGGFENQLNISLSLLLIGGLVLARWEEMSRWRARAWTAGLSLLAFGVTGMHEMIALMLCIVLATGTAIALKTRRSTHQGWAWVAVSLSALIGLAVVVVAPGNSIRSSLYPKHGGMIHALEVAWGLAWQLLPSWVLDVRLLAATLVLVLNPSLARARAGGPRWGGISPKLVVTAVWLLIVAGMFLGPSYVLHTPMPGRTLNATYTLFVLGWITAVIVWTRSHAESGGATVTSQEANGPRFARSAALAVLGLSLLVTGNTCNGIVGLRNGVPQNWKRMIHWRDRLILKAVRGGATQVVLPIHDFAAINAANWPRMYSFFDITEHPTYWVNQHVALYYGLQAIRRVPPEARLSAKPERQMEVVGLKPDSAPIGKQ